MVPKNKVLLTVATTTTTDKNNIVPRKHKAKNDFPVTYTSDSTVKMYVSNDSMAIHLTGSFPWKIK